jgi:hypothetical protein
MVKYQTIKYYLVEGEEVNFAFFPGSFVSNELVRLAKYYFEKAKLDPTRDFNGSLLFKVDAATYASFMKEMNAALSPYDQHGGAGPVRLWTDCGPFEVFVTYDSPWPVFFGTESEYTDNKFHLEFENHIFKQP